MEKFGCWIASQYTAGTDVSELIRFVANQLQECLNVERRHDDGSSAGRAHREQLAVTPCHMKQRHRNQRPNTPVEGKRHDAAAGFDVRKKPSMRGHRAFGKTGGAAGVENRRDVLPRKILYDFAGPFRQGFAGRKNELAAGILDDIIGLCIAESCIDGNGDRAGHLDAEKREAPVESIAEADGHAVTSADSLIPQPARHARGTIPQFTIVDARPAGFDDCFRPRSLLDGRAQHLHQRSG